MEELLSLRLILLQGFKKVVTLFLFSFCQLLSGSVPGVQIDSFDFKVSFEEKIILKVHLHLPLE